MYDVIVIGAGIMGSCTGYQLSKRGKKVLLLEQFTLSHNQGSSHGASRIIRFAHTESAYLPLIKKAYNEWDKLSAAVDDKLYKSCGLLWVASPNSIKEKSDILKNFNIEHSILKGDEIQLKFPHLSYDESWHGLYDPKAGFVYADRALKAAQSQFLANGGIIKENETVLKIEESQNGVEIFTQNSKFIAKKVVVTAGAWLNTLFNDLQIQTRPELIGLTFWKVKCNHSKFLPSNNSPVMIMSDNCEEMYMIPEVDYSGEIKIGVHCGIPIDVRNKSRIEPPKWTIDIPSEHLKKHFKDVEWEKPTRRVSCLYTLTPDHNYILDFHPKNSNIIIGGGFSGSGFKFGAVIGLILAKMALNETIDLDLSIFKLNREIIIDKSRL
uniref:Sarcosine oxidasee (formaldehyde-forming) n=1 Tax=Panagrolaimus sp. PS1159 TaxID=55785 RepID=A0AC35F1I3_9BILA